MAGGFVRKEIPRAQGNLKSGAKTGVEARRTPRRVFKRPIGVLHAGEYGVVAALQLSENGLLFTAESAEQLDYKVKDQIVVTLILPDGEGVVARGEVIYENPGTGGLKQFGVKFATLALPVRRAIRNYVTAKTQAEAENEEKAIH